jgi:hypothetical protein
MFKLKFESSKENEVYTRHEFSWGYGIYNEKEKKWWEVSFGDEPVYVGHLNVSVDEKGLLIRN